MAVVGSLRSKPTKEVESLNNAVVSVRNQVAAIGDDHRAVLSRLGKEAEIDLENATAALDHLLALVREEMTSIKLDNTKRRILQSAANDLKKRLQQAKTDEENSRDAYRDRIDAAASQIAEAVALRLGRKDRQIDPVDVDVRSEGRRLAALSSCLSLVSRKSIGTTASRSWATCSTKGRCRRSSAASKVRRISLQRRSLPASL